LVVNHDFVYIHFTHIAASNTTTNDVAKLITHIECLIQKSTLVNDLMMMVIVVYFLSHFVFYITKTDANIRQIFYRAAANWKIRL